ncbi:MAG: class I SAM-dependent methyltransferase [Lachnospiraceae bacterium]|nr:class I SAM-dependent methyltransferase [Lachnospiraceae bacterium]
MQREKMVMILRRICPGCGKKNTDNKKIFMRNFSPCRELVPFVEYGVYHCDRCGLSFAGDIEESMPLNVYYEKMSRYEGDNFLLSPMLKKHYQFIVDTLCKKISSNASILDVGCAFGGLLNTFKEEGYSNVCGIEPSKKNCEFAKRNYDIHVIQGALGDENEELKYKKFDLIILSGVLEHLMDIKTSINQCCELLNGNGILAVITPDVAMFEEHEDLFQEFSVEHINYFDIDSLSYIMAEKGFSKILYAKDHESIMGLAGSMVTAWRFMENAEVFDSSIWGTDNENRIDSYIQKCRLFQGRITERVKKYDTSDGYYIWGAGTNAAILVQLGIIDIEKIRGVFDSNMNYHGLSAYGNVVHDPKMLKDEKELPIIISSQYAYNAILNSINDMGLNNSIINVFGGD